MTDQNPSAHATQPAAGPITVTAACVHIDAAANQVEAAVTVVAPAAGWVAWVEGFWSVMTWLLSSVERFPARFGGQGRMAPAGDGAG